MARQCRARRSKARQGKGIEAELVSAKVKGVDGEGDSPTYNSTHKPATTTTTTRINSRPGRVLGDPSPPTPYPVFNPPEVAVAWSGEPQAYPAGAGTEP